MLLIYLPWNARAAAASEAEQQAKRSALAADARRQRVLDGVASIYERGVAQRDDVKPPVPGDDDALLAAVEALLDAHSADLAALKQEHEAQAEKRREAGQHLAAELAEAAAGPGRAGRRGRAADGERCFEGAPQAFGEGGEEEPVRPSGRPRRTPMKRRRRRRRRNRTRLHRHRSRRTTKRQQRASDARRAAFRADIRKALDLNVARTAAAEFEREGLSASTDDDAAVDSEKPDESWLEDDEDAPIAGLPGVQVLKYERPDDRDQLRGARGGAGRERHDGRLRCGAGEARGGEPPRGAERRVASARRRTSSWSGCATRAGRSSSRRPVKRRPTNVSAAR